MCEFEIVSSATDAIVTLLASIDAHFSTTNTSTSWQVKHARMVAYIVTLDNGLQNSHADHILSGKSLPLNYSTYISFCKVLYFPT